MTRSLPPRAGFTVLELLIAMALFSVLGLAVVALLGQGMTIFSEGTADTSMQDRLQSVLPAIRADLAAVQPVSPPEVPPPPPPEGDPGTDPAAQAVPTPPDVRLRAGWLKLSDVPSEWPPVYYVAFARTFAREAEDPILRRAGTDPVGPGIPAKSYDPATVDAGAATNLLAPGGLQEVVWVAVPEDPAPERRTGAPTPDSSWSRSVLTLYRLFRAPVGGEKTLLDPKNFDSLAKIRAAGRPMHDGVLHFGVTFRNVFARSFTDGLGTGRVDDGQAYVGAVWDSTRALDKAFALYRDAGSLADVRDDVFPAWARVEVTLAVEGPFGFGRGDTVLSTGVGPDDRRLRLESVEPVLRPGQGETWLKVGTEWVSTTFENVDPSERLVTVARKGRGTAAAEHPAGTPVFVGGTVSTDVPMVYKDRYTRRR
ncbi:MAG: prepilin-type N-terminal cleavage/methylation domain-containing protein [Planctomycetes bacterium]|nr:prepilin-type N-terminal cleavage/methylation domain-containing protein [Planctomycetota bacterium]